MHRARYVGKFAKLPCPLQVRPSPQGVFINPESLWSQSFRVFMKAALHRYKWLNHWPLVIELNLQTLTPPQRLGIGTESSNPLIKRLIPLETCPHPQVLSKNHLIDIRKATFRDCSHHLGNSKGFRSSVLGRGWRPSIYFLKVTISQEPLHDFKTKSDMILLWFKWTVLVTENQL